MRPFLLALAFVGGVAVLMVLALRPDTATNAQVAAASPAEASNDSESPGSEAPATALAAAKLERSDGRRVYYQYVDNGSVRFAESLEAVPEEWRDRAGRIEMDAAPPVATRTASAAPKRRIRRQAAPASQASGKRSWFDDDDGDATQVTIYTMERCGYCTRAMNYMDEIGQPYHNRDIDRDPEARDDYLKLTRGNAGVPVIDVGGQVMQGWNQDRLDDLLEGS